MSNLLGSAVKHVDKVKRKQMKRSFLFRVQFWLCGSARCILQKSLINYGCDLFFSFLKFSNASTLREKALITYYRRWNALLDINWRGKFWHHFYVTSRILSRRSRRIKCKWRQIPGKLLCLNGCLTNVSESFPRSFPRGERRIARDVAFNELNDDSGLGKVFCEMKYSRAGHSRAAGIPSKWINFSLEKKCTGKWIKIAVIFIDGMLTLRDGRGRFTPWKTCSPGTSGKKKKGIDFPEKTFIVI